MGQPWAHWSWQQKTVLFHEAVLVNSDISYLVKINILRAAKQGAVAGFSAWSFFSREKKSLIVRPNAVNKFTKILTGC